MDCGRLRDSPECPHSSRVRSSGVHSACLGGAVAALLDSAVRLDKRLVFLRLNFLLLENGVVTSPTSVLETSWVLN